MNRLGSYVMYAIKDCRYNLAIVLSRTTYKLLFWYNKLVEYEL